MLCLRCVLIVIFPLGDYSPGCYLGCLKVKTKGLSSSLYRNCHKSCGIIEPNLRFAPLSKLEWKQFYINIGDRSVSIGFKHPYPGWNTFRVAIIKVIQSLQSAKFIKSIERYSLKYIDLLPAANLDEQVSYVISI